jgi:hypothetical protein
MKPIDTDNPPCSMSSIDWIGLIAMAGKKEVEKSNGAGGGNKKKSTGYKRLVYRSYVRIQLVTPSL